ncbi:MATE family efflux transporter [Vibrio sp. Vb2880]|uniref:Multidrug export protein MepA n=1 Tax=Vibrio furnissii TaxID=29494 RepID=A0A0Q2QYG1_VIBFU|nr:MULTISPECIES: MATE family efflux transporter [Vibrio]ADT86142.1 multidrug efflux pump VmrA [Vibrio furnissii NCTC 11218]KQH85005.1 MATE family efflux transporter [Vibrio furnissii]MBO0215044.1 MATE family efflux transporter [Vibrio sp. Vb2880]MCG6231130.1 MATE family efflux transporter [Vibrio furnissii]TRN23102.1 MATE family efflux transporter [Vibrio furnissii]
MNTAINRQFLRYAIPTVAAMLVNGLYQVVDGIFIGHYVGATGLAGINVAWPVIGTILGVGMLVGVGTGALVSIKQGEKDLHSAKRILATGLLTLVMLAPVVATLLWFFADDFLRWQGAQGRTFELGMQYLQVLIVGCVFTLGSIAMPFLLRNDDSPNLATMLMVVGALCNIVLDYVLIAWWQWELTGAAIATAISQLIVTGLGLSYFFSKRAKLRLTRACLTMEWRYLPKIFAIGVSSFFMYAYGSTMVALHNSLIIQYGDAVMVGAYAILGYIVTVYYLTVEGIANGMQPLASFNHGARQYDNIRRLLKLAMSIAVLGGVVFVVLINLFPEQVIGIFNSDDPRLMEGAVFALKLHMFALFLDGFLVVSAAYYQATNHGGKAMFVTVGNMLVQLPFLYMLPKLYGITGVWIAFPLSNIALTAVVAVMLWRDVSRLGKPGAPAYA